MTIAAPPDVAVKHCPLCDQDAIVYRGRWSIHLDTHPNRTHCLMSGLVDLGPGWMFLGFGEGDS